MRRSGNHLRGGISRKLRVRIERDDEANLAQGRQVAGNRVELAIAREQQLVKVV